MKEIKICYTISSLNKEGPVNVLLNIVSNLDLSKFDVHIITLNPEKQNSIINAFNKFSLTIHQLNLKGKSLFPPIITYNKIINKISPDIVHSHCLMSLMLNFIFSRDKSVHTVHIYPGIQTIKKKGFLLGSILLAVNKFFTKKIKFPIACSKSVADNFILKDKFMMHYIQNGVYKPEMANIDKYRLKKSLGLKPDVSYFISIGRFSPEKNFNFLIKSFNKLNMPGVGLIILGDGALLDELKKNGNENIIFTGFVQDTNSYLTASDYYISSSITEGLPMSVLEALSFGLPLLLSNISSHEEIITRDKIGKVGYIYENNNFGSFYNFLEKSLKDDYLKTSEECNFLYNKYFTAKIMAMKYQEFYLKMS
jgi:glycosyltransferase involved in cell wall biosynthesis